jgi:hypothetical protein
MGKYCKLWMAWRRTGKGVIGMSGVVFRVRREDNAIVGVVGTKESIICLYVLGARL